MRVVTVDMCYCTFKLYTLPLAYCARIQCNVGSQIHATAMLHLGQAVKPEATRRDAMQRNATRTVLQKRCPFVIHTAKHKTAQVNMYIHS